jgi:hypothetical protein
MVGEEVQVGLGIRVSVGVFASVADGATVSVGLGVSRLSAVTWAITVWAAWVCKASTGVSAGVGVAGLQAARLKIAIQRANILVRQWLLILVCMGNPFLHTCPFEGISILTDELPPASSSGGSAAKKPQDCVSLRRFLLVLMT